MALLGEISVANIFNSQEKHIVFPVSDEGAMLHGSARSLYQRWPGLIPNDKLKGLPGRPIEEDGKTFYPVECYFDYEKIGWTKAPQILGEFLSKKLLVPANIPVGVIVPGS